MKAINNAVGPMGEHPQSASGKAFRGQFFSFLLRRKSCFLANQIDQNGHQVPVSMFGVGGLMAIYEGNRCSEIGNDASYPFPSMAI